MERIGRSAHVESTFPKADGRRRPLGIAALEDKIVQQAVVTIFNQIYEVDFTERKVGTPQGAVVSPLLYYPAGTHTLSAAAISALGASVETLTR